MFIHVRSQSDLASEGIHMAMAVSGPTNVFADMHMSVYGYAESGEQLHAEPLPAGIAAGRSTPRPGLTA